MRLSHSLFCLGLLSLLLLAQEPTPAPSPDLPFYKKLGEANKEANEKNFTKALALLEEAEKLKPNTSEASSIKGSIYLGQKEFEKAHEIFLKNATLLPDNIGAQYNLAEAEFVQGALPASREKLSKLLEIVKATPKDKTNTLPWGDATADFFTYKIYLTYIFEGNLTEGKKMLDKFDPYAITPLYYFGCSAMEFGNKNNIKALEWIGSAAKIYNPLLIELFSNAMFDKGWIRKGAKPGDITTDIAPVDKK